MLRYWAVLSGLQTYESYLEILFFWLPFYAELKLAALIWLVTPGSSGPQWLFDRLLHPAMAVASFHLQRDIIPRIAAAALHTARKLQTKTLPRFANAVRRDELKMWDRSIRGQLASVQMELERRRMEGAPIAIARLPDAPAAALLADSTATKKQILKELLEPAVTATANGGICGAYKRGESTLPSRMVSRLGRAAGLAGGADKGAALAGAGSDGEASEGEAAERAAARAVRFAAEDADDQPLLAQTSEANPRTPPAQPKAVRTPAVGAVAAGMAALPPSPATSMMSGRTGMLNTPAGRSVDTSVLTSATGEREERAGETDVLEGGSIGLLKTLSPQEIVAEDRRISHVNTRRRSAKKNADGGASPTSEQDDTRGEVAI